MVTRLENGIRYHRIDVLNSQLDGLIDNLVRDSRGVMGRRLPAVKTLAAAAQLRRGYEKKIRRHEALHINHDRATNLRDRQKYRRRLEQTGKIFPLWHG